MMIICHLLFDFIQLMIMLENLKHSMLIFKIFLRKCYIYVMLWPSCQIRIHLRLIQKNINVI